VTLTVSVTLRVPSGLQSPTDTEIVPVGHPASSSHCRLPEKRSSQAGFDAQNALTLIELPQMQVAATSTDQLPPELSVVALDGPLPQSTWTTTSCLIVGEKTIGSHSLTVPVTRIALVTPPAERPITDVMLREQAMHDPPPAALRRLCAGARFRIYYNTTIPSQESLELRARTIAAWRGARCGNAMRIYL